MEMNKFRNSKSNRVKATSPIEPLHLSLLKKGFDEMRMGNPQSLTVPGLSQAADPASDGGTRQKGATGNSKGVVLVMVLWITIILSVMALEFSFAMRTEVNVARNYKEQSELQAIAEGGIQRAVAEMIFKHDARIQQLRITMKPEEFPPDQREWIADGRVYLVPFNQGKCEVRMMNEGGKVNINLVSDVTLRKIIGQFGLEGEATDVVVDSIMDWRDPDDFIRINGAENDYYQSLKEPYNCKNGNLDSIEELLLVRGVTRDLFYGKKAQNEGGEGTTGSQVGLKDIFSIYSFGEQVDINSAALPVLTTVLGLPPGVAQQIITAREQKPFTQQDFLTRVPEFTPFMAGVGNLISYQSTLPYYTLEVKAMKEEGKSVRGIRAIIKVDMNENQGYKVIQWIDAAL